MSSVFKYLEKILGKSSSYYEMLMKSRKEQSHITPQQVDALVVSIQSISKICIYYKKSLNEVETLPIGDNQKWPTDHKLNPLPFLGSFETENFNLELFADLDKASKDNRFQHLHIYEKIGSSNSIAKLAPRESLSNKPKYNGFKGDSYPIWEEIVHRYPKVNDMIKITAPDNPWTLYKKALDQLDITAYDIQLGGYPQWLINDVDFRKIKKLEFLLELKLQKSTSIYYFYDHDIKEIFMIKQKL